MALIYARTRLLAATVGSALALSACTVHSTNVPALSGPSGLGSNITISVSPDILTQDGASQSLVTVTADGSNGQPAANLSLRLAVVVNGGITTDPVNGSLSALNVVTNGSGQATAVFTAPPSASCAGCPDTGRTVEIAAIPAGTDFSNSITRTATIRLLPVGVISAPPSTGVTAAFTFNPSSPQDHQPVVFDGSSSRSTSGTIVSYQWKFGDDGSTASGPTVQHTFTSGGDFTVTLVASDNKGGSNTTAQVVHVTAVTLAPPAIVVSPTSASSGQQVFFTSTTTVGSNGHSIVGYSWNFGDGSTGSGQSVSHAFAVEGSYTVLLTITDDQGHTSTGTQPISVIDTHAAFTFNPASPTTTTPVSFDGSGSKAAGGRTIVTYQWNFGDGASGTGVTTSHKYAAAGSYTVTLKVTDSAGFTSSVSQTITVTP
jgi:PKD repeat protein